MVLPEAKLSLTLQTFEALCVSARKPMYVQAGLLSLFHSRLAVMIDIAHGRKKKDGRMSRPSATLQRRPQQPYAFLLTAPPWDTPTSARP